MLDPLPRHVALALLLLSAPTAAGRESGWPSFRGPGGSGIAADAEKLPTHFGPAKNVLWKAELPGGWSSPCVHGQRVFLAAFDPTTRTLETIGLDRATGKVLWRRAAPAGRIERVEKTSSPATATPACDGQRVVVYFGSYGALCYGLDGKELWKLPLPTPKTRYGTGTSPAIANGLVLLKIEGQSGSLLALDVATGKERWKKEKLPFDPGPSLPLVRAVKGGHEVILHGERGIRSYDLADGKERWSMPVLMCEAIPSPFAADGLVYLTSQIPGGDADDRFQLPPFKEVLAKHDKNKDGMIDRQEARGVILYQRDPETKEGTLTLANFFAAFDRNGDGKISALEWGLGQLLAGTLNNSLAAVRCDDGDKPAAPQVVWREQNALPEVATPLAYRGRLYTAKHGGIVSCLDAKTGKLLDRKRVGAVGMYYASPVAGDGKVYLATLKGVVVVLKAGDKLEVLARNDLGEAIAATPALVGGVIYLRTEKHLYAFRE